MKKVILVAAIVITAGIIWLNSTVIFHPSGTAVQICYERENISFELALSQEEVNLWKPAISLRLGSSCRVSQSRLYQIKSNTIKLL